MRFVSGAIRLEHAVLCVECNIIVPLRDLCPLCGEEPHALIVNWLNRPAEVR